jgi:hypothetical protein
MARNEDTHKAVQNGHSAGQYVSRFGINVRRVVDLLVTGSGVERHHSVRRSANAVLELMAANVWTVTAGPHQAGRGGDNTVHITVRVAHKSYHIRLDNKGHVFQITGDSIGPGVPPWIAPGAEY